MDKFVVILLNLVITFSICSLPIIIYRFGIRKYAVAPKKAKWISILYGIFAFVLICVIAFFLDGKVTGGPEIVWSIINYNLLKKEGEDDYLYYRDNSETDGQSADTDASFSEDKP